MRAYQAASRKGEVHEHFASVAMLLADILARGVPPQRADTMLPEGLLVLLGEIVLDYPCTVLLEGTINVFLTYLGALGHRSYELHASLAKALHALSYAMQYLGGSRDGSDEADPLDALSNMTDALRVAHILDQPSCRQLISSMFPVLLSSSTTLMEPGNKSLVWKFELGCPIPLSSPYICMHHFKITHFSRISRSHISALAVDSNADALEPCGALVHLRNSWEHTRSATSKLEYSPECRCSPLHRFLGPL